VIFKPRLEGGNESKQKPPNDLFSEFVSEGEQAIIEGACKVPDHRWWVFRRGNSHSPLSPRRGEVPPVESLPKSTSLFMAGGT
jgi:hypothetical protein